MTFEQKKTNSVNLYKLNHVRIIGHTSLVLGMPYRNCSTWIYTAQTYKQYTSQQSVGASVGTDSVKSMWDRDLTKYTKIKEKITDIEPKAMVIFSWADEGFKNILMLISAHVDSVQELYSPDDQS